MKQWKNKVITAKPFQFDIKKRSYEELLHNINQAEVVHFLSMVFSYLPLLLIIPFGAKEAFIITSILASLIDLPFFLIQRYNRPRIIKIMQKNAQ